MIQRRRQNEFHTTPEGTTAHFHLLPHTSVISIGPAVLILRDRQPVVPGSRRLATCPWHVTERCGTWTSALLQWALEQHRSMRLNPHGC